MRSWSQAKHGVRRYELDREQDRTSDEPELLSCSRDEPARCRAAAAARHDRHTNLQLRVNRVAHEAFPACRRDWAPTPADDVRRRTRARRAFARDRACGPLSGLALALAGGVARAS